MGISIRLITRRNKMENMDFMSICIGVITDDKPIMNNMLNMLEPTTFPTDISNSFFFAESRETASSGREVPIDTTLNAITTVGTDRAWAIATDESTSNLAPIITLSRPKITNKIYFLILLSLPRFSCMLFFLSFDATFSIYII